MNPGNHATSLTASITQGYQAGPGSGAPRVAAAGGPRRGPESDARASFRALLLLRLRILCVLGFGGWSLFDVLLLGGLDPLFRAGVVAPGCVALILVTTVAPLFCVTLLLLRPGLPVGWLRCMEALLVGLCTASLAW